MTPSRFEPRARRGAAMFAASLVLGFAAGLSALPPASAGDVTDKAVMLFRDACLATAPAFDKAMAAAKKHGIKPQMDLGASLVGMAPDGSYSLQVRGKKECAVTAEKSAGPAVAEQFRSVIGVAAGVPATSLASEGPIQITMRGQTYVVRHDRKGGEAYVIMSTAGL
ncbi:hypothetical protein FZC33_13960 [Labrys sp. KNU-23]|uniref:hypothetical protein n=1 Tax=Labrys sp. KNU-23 TaxID=2789216 RepID=UPI0011ED5E15|nr:hypothetical protein [Labrys sp. KNU-23]QEN87363.1 hypothetical protein FZC33_13960 [Labrys sp. KNU-23]